MSAGGAFAVIRSWMATKLMAPKAVIDALERFIADKSVSFREMADLPAHTIIGRDNVLAGTPQALTLSGGLDFTGTGGIEIAAHGVTNDKFRQSAGLSLVGNATNATADVADITAALDGQVMRRSGTAIAFGAVNLASANAVTGVLPFGNGGTGQSAYTDGQLLIGNTSTGGLSKATLTAGSGITITNAGGAITVASSATGTVTSVGLSLPATFTVSGSPVTTSGTLTAVYATQSANTLFAGPTTGAAAAPTFRALVAADLPNTAVTAGSYTSANITVDAQGRITLAANGSSGAGTVTHTAGSLTSGQLIVGNGSGDIKVGDLSGDVSTSGSGVTTIGALKVATGMIQASAVTYAKLQNVSANSVLLGAGASGSGAAPAEIALGTGLTMTGTTLSASGSVSGANPTATAGPTAVNGSAATFMRSDGAPAVQLGSASQAGLVQVDGTSITASGGVISATAGGGSSLALLEAHTASSSASLVFTSAISSTYDDYLIEFIDVLPATGSNNLYMRVSTNGGTSYDSGTNYEWSAAFSAPGASGNNTGNTSVAQIVVAGTNVSNGTFGVNGTVKMFNPLSASLNKKFIMDVTWFHDSLTTGIRAMGYGRYKSNTAVNALQFIMSSGNIASGTIRIYGIAH